MNRRQIGLASAVAVLVATGLLIEVLAQGVESIDPPAQPGRRISERALFCPPSLKGMVTSTTLSITPTSADPYIVGLSRRQSRVDVAAEHSLEQEVVDKEAVSVTGFGAPLVAASSTVVGGDVPGGLASQCAPSASERWLFPEGSSLLGFDERLLIYNPFPEEAVARVTLFTPKGERNPASLADIPVPAGLSTTVAMKDHVGTLPVVGASVSSVRGRVVAWRAVLADPGDRRGGAYATLGAAAPSETWYFPDGAVERGVDERIAVLNPSEEEATVTISLIKSDRIVQPTKLSEILVPARSVESFKLADLGPANRKLGGVSALVQSTNGVEIVAERTTWYRTETIKGVSSEVGSPEPGTSWILGAPTPKPSTDVVYVMNTSPETARVALKLIRSGGAPIEPVELAAIVVPGGLRLKIPIGAFTKGRPMAVLLTSDQPIVAERSAFSDAASDIASLMGVLLVP